MLPSSLAFSGVHVCNIILSCVVDAVNNEAVKYFRLHCKIVNKILMASINERLRKKNTRITSICQSVLFWNFSPMHRSPIIICTFKLRKIFVNLVLLDIFRRLALSMNRVCLKEFIRIPIIKNKYRPDILRMWYCTVRF